MRFKVGDRVRYISDQGMVPKGACGTIRKIEKDDVYHVPYVVRLDNKVGKDIVIMPLRNSLKLHMNL